METESSEIKDGEIRGIEPGDKIEEKYLQIFLCSVICTVFVEYTGLPSHPVLLEMFPLPPLCPHGWSRNSHVPTRHNQQREICSGVELEPTRAVTGLSRNHGTEKERSRGESTDERHGEWCS